MDRGPGDPRQLLEIWMQWERGEGMPGKILSDLKREGMRELLDALAAAAAEAGEDGPAPA